MKAHSKLKCVLAFSLGLSGCAAFGHAVLVHKAIAANAAASALDSSSDDAGLTRLDSNKAVTDNYKDYIQKLPPEERKYAGPIEYFQHGTGQHAVRITIGLKGTVWRHILIYDKDDKRVKAIKYASGNYRS